MGIIWSRAAKSSSRSGGGTQLALPGPPEIGSGLGVFFFQSLQKLGGNSNLAFGVQGGKTGEGRNIGVTGLVKPCSLHRQVKVCWGKKVGKRGCWRQRRPRPWGKQETHKQDIPVLVGKGGEPQGFLPLGWTEYLKDKYPEPEYNWGAQRLGGHRTNEGARVRDPGLRME